jgi:pimeloyl-ACP methyl ester carboxylesterase
MTPSTARPDEVRALPVSPATTEPTERGSFDDGDLRLAYEIHGSGDRVIVFLHGLLFDAKMNRPLAAALAAQGHRVILLDLPGHGMSDKSRHASIHRMDAYAERVVHLLDHLEISKAIIGGVSLGANVSLFVAARAPERLRALIIEMPVLERAVPACALIFTPLLLAIHYAAPGCRLVAQVAERIPHTGNGPFDSLLHTLTLQPEEVTSVLHGILVGPIAPTYEERGRITCPTLVIGHRSDLVHPFADAANLASQIPTATLLTAHTLFELRVRPERLANEICQFLDRAWSTPDQRVSGASTRQGRR